jgi:hypothetical protein
LSDYARVRFPAHLFDRMVKLAHAKGLTIPEVLGRAFLSYEAYEDVKAKWLDEARERQERLGGDGG